MDKWLYLSGTCIIGLLGFLHLIFMILDERKPKRLVPKSRHLLDHMREDPLRMTNETTIWRAWVGFNHSHSLGAIFVAFLYGYLVIFNYETLKSLTPIYYAGPALAWIYVWLAKTYWFSRPFIGLLLSAILLSVSLLIP